MNAAPQFHVILFQPEIPPNTGNVIRLCANTGAQLHLVEPLGFALEDKQLKRAGLDYHEYSRLQVHPDLDTALARIAPKRLFALSTRPASVMTAWRSKMAMRSCSARKAAACRRTCSMHCPMAPPAPADAAGQPQPQSFQHRRRGDVRGVAPAWVCRRRVTASQGGCGSLLVGVTCFWWVRTLVRTDARSRAEGMCQPRLAPTKAHPRRLQGLLQCVQPRLAPTDHFRTR
jgi:hypothetical protein